MEILNIRVEFILFALTLAGIAIFHRHTMYVSLAGLVLILLFKFFLSPDEFHFAEHFLGTPDHKGEWSTLVNLGGLLLGFAILTKHFEESGIPGYIPRILPGGWAKGFILLGFILLLSSFLDNIAAAMLGGTIAAIVYRGRVHIAYLASIIAASNAGGAGSVIGDTTTTLMWIDGIHPVQLFPAYIGSFAAYILFGLIGAKIQNRYIKSVTTGSEEVPVSNNQALPWNRASYLKLTVVILIIAGAIATNYMFNFPSMGIWMVILASSLFIKTPWQMLGKAFKGTIFLLALVTSASLMPVNELPAASVRSTFLLGLLSSVFDNIPLTKLCIEQGGYRWDLLAYAIGFGGSMIWFGSSAGVALSNLYPEIKSTGLFLRNSWHIILAYITGFFLLWLSGALLPG